MSASFSNFDRPTKEILIDLIYQFNKYRVPVQHITFGLPEPLDLYPGIVTDENTFVPVTVNEIYDNRFDGRNGFLYRRISMTELVEDMSVKFDLPEFPFRMAEILPHLNLKFHTQLTVDDIENTLVESPAQLVLAANKYSLVFVDEVQFHPGGYIPPTVRLLESGEQRITEDGALRVMEESV